eukprot:TRINITY_DN9276_c0_g1_i1.p1 TRINITY_DN9276_c0_g1~~TRINITY_DN9276_c0_g1_i1.p1  ORF type:complete len:123 (+),score=7.77 TRINITY_DN9276_c0_g1_i1:147-515(+)
MTSIQEYLKDVNKQKELVELCSTALGSCIMCEERSKEEKHDKECSSKCAACNSMLNAALRVLCSRAPRAEEVLKLSADMAKDCSDMCQKHESTHCKDCSSKCGRWSKRVMEVLQCVEKGKVE